jgi:hypothetical protein
MNGPNALFSIVRTVESSVRCRILNVEYNGLGNRELWAFKLPGDLGNRLQKTKRFKHDPREHNIGPSTEAPASCHHPLSFYTLKITSPAQMGTSLGSPTVVEGKAELPPGKIKKEPHGQDRPRHYLASLGLPKCQTIATLNSTTE